MDEIWGDIPNYKDYYQVSNFGRIRGLERIVKRGNFYLNVKGKILKPRNDKDGYLIINLSINNSRKTFRIQRLVIISFQGCGILNGFVADHIDNNKLNNRLDNLQIITHRKNCSKDQKNRSSKYTGVTWNKRDKRWKSCIRIDGKQKYLGYFKNEYKAHLAYQKELNLHFGNNI